MNYSKKYSKLIYLLIFIIVTQCGLYKKGAVDYRKEPAQATDRARKNVEEGRGVSLKSLTNRKTSYEFSTSNPMWRAFRSSRACCRPLLRPLRRFQVHQWHVLVCVSFRLRALWARVCCRIACCCWRKGGGMCAKGGAIPRA